MDTQEKKEILPTNLHQSIMLAKQARKEKREFGQVFVVCPKCQEHPVIYLSPDGERLDVRCKCGFVQDGEIYFSPMTKFMKERRTDV